MPARRYLFLLYPLLLSIGCTDNAPIDPTRYRVPDQYSETVLSIVDHDSDLTLIADIDHSRLAAAQGVPMPPARVILASSPGLEASLLAQNPLTALDLPLRVLSYEDAEGSPAVIYNPYSFLKSRHDLPDGPELGKSYEALMNRLVDKIPPEARRQFSIQRMEERGIIDLESRFAFDDTLGRVRDAIDAQGDTVWFGEVDYQELAASQGVDLRPLRLFLFGGPAPGGKAMSEAPTLGLDAFCQKLAIWEDEAGQVHVSFNDLLALAERQEVTINVALRVINKRMKSTFESAVQP